MGEIALRITKLPESQGKMQFQKLERLYSTLQKGLCVEGGWVKAYGSLLLPLPLQLPQFESLAQWNDKSEPIELSAWNTDLVLSGNSTHPRLFVSNHPTYQCAIESVLQIWEEDNAWAWVSKPLRDYFKPPTPVALVDPYSSGRFLVQRCRALEMSVICVRSTLQIEECDVQSYEQQLDDFHCTHTLEASGSTNSSLEELAEELRSWGLVAVIPGSELGVELAEKLAKMLNLTGNDPCSSIRRKDKHAMQEVLRQEGIPSASSCRGSYEVLQTWAGNAGNAGNAGSGKCFFPVILKPPVSFATQGVSFCESIEEVKQAFDATYGTVNAHGVQIHEMVGQEFLHGVEFMVDTVSRHGQHLFVAAWEHSKSGSKILSKTSTILPWSDLVEKLFNYACKVLDALGVRYGAANLEIIDVPDRGPILVEINARMIGHIGPSVIEKSLGISLLDLVLDSFTCGKCELLSGSFDQVSSCHPAQRPASFGFLPARLVRLTSPRDGQLRSSIDCEHIRELPSFHSIYTSKTKGSKLKKTRDKMSTAGMVLLMDEDMAKIEQATRRIQELEGTTLYDWEDAIAIQDWDPHGQNACTSSFLRDSRAAR